MSNWLWAHPTLPCCHVHVSDVTQQVLIQVQLGEVQRRTSNGDTGKEKVQLNPLAKNMTRREESQACGGFVSILMVIGVGANTLEVTRHSQNDE